LRALGRRGLGGGRRLLRALGRRGLGGGRGRGTGDLEPLAHADDVAGKAVQLPELGGSHAVPLGNG
jgi:hypothetical protein